MGIIIISHCIGKYWTWRKLRLRADEAILEIISAAEVLPDLLQDVTREWNESTPMGPKAKVAKVWRRADV